MQWRSLRVLLALSAIAATLFCTMFQWSAANPAPSVTFTLIGYTRTNWVAYTEILEDDEGMDRNTATVRFTTSKPRAGGASQQHTSVLLAQVRIQNGSSYPIFYESQTDMPYYDCRLLSSNVTTLCTYYRFTGV